MPLALDHTRREWEDGHRRLEREVRKLQSDAAVLSELDAILAALRRRVGQTFTLAELAECYETAERWSREAVAETQPGAGWAPRLATLTEAAFYLYSRGAVDYEP